MSKEPIGTNEDPFTEGCRRAVVQKLAIAIAPGLLEKAIATKRFEDKKPLNFEDVELVEMLGTFVGKAAYELATAMEMEFSP